MNSERLRAMLALVLFIFIVPQYGFSHKITSDDGDFLSKSVVVLQVTDPLPKDAVKLSSLQIGGEKNAINGSYQELVKSARILAAKSDANIIKITQRTPRSATNKYDQLNITLYKAANPRKSEKEFGWTAGRKLTWEDFRGPEQPQMGEDVAAATYCGIGFETNTLTAPTDKLKIFVYNTFYPVQSWVKAGVENDHILAHEQCHFDICELYTRKLRERMSRVNVTATTMKTTLRSIYGQLQKEYVARQELYETETEHGIIEGEQDRWENMIAMELKASDNWREE